VQDPTAGIALSFAGFAPTVAQQGQDLAVDGTLASQNGELTVVVDSPSDVAATSGDSMPTATSLAAVLACEPFESQLISVEGTLVAAPGFIVDGLTTVLDDGPVRSRSSRLRDRTWRSEIWPPAPASG